MAKREKITAEEKAYLAIELSGFRIRKKREKAEKLAAKYFDPNKGSESYKHYQLVDDFLMLMDNLDTDLDADPD